MTTDEIREGWDRRYAGQDYVWKVEPNQFVLAHLADLAPGRAVDLGAGEGRNAVWLATKGWQVTAVDISPVGLEKGARLAAEHGAPVDFVEGDVISWEPAEPVDLVVISYLQIPTPERLAVLRRAATWLVPGATLFVIAHDRSNIENGHGGPQNPDVCYTVEETVAALSGLDVTIAEVAERVVATDDGEKVALDTLVMALRPAEQG
jgi:SAM-dependent methyltransferase